MTEYGHNTLNIEIPPPVIPTNYERGKATFIKFIDSFYTRDEINNVIDRLCQITMNGDHALSRLTATNLKMIMSNVVPTRENFLWFIENSPLSRIFSSQWMAYYFWHEGSKSKQPNEVTRLNNELVTHTETGALNTIKSKDIIQHFKRGHEDEWPQIVLTANHTLTTGSQHVSGIMDNIDGLLKGLFNGNVQLDRRPDRKTDKKGKTFIVAAIHTEQNPELNGGSLLFRNWFLRNPQNDLARRVAPKVEAVDKPDSFLFAFLRAVGIQPDYQVELKHRGPSPAAMRLAKTMLKAMLVDPDALDHPDRFLPKRPGEKEERDMFVNDRRTCADRILDGQPYVDASGKSLLVLRPDAAKIASHFTLIGFSKGANVVDDAKRILAYELSSKVNGRSVFSVRVEKKEPDGAVVETEIPLARRDVKKYVRAVSLIGAAGPGVPLTNEEIELGASRIRINNARDFIAGHFDYGMPKPVESNSKYDRLFKVRGTDANLGHDADEFLGSGDKKGFLHLGENKDVTNALREELGHKFGMPVKRGRNPAEE